VASHGVSCKDFHEFHHRETGIGMKKIPDYIDKMQGNIEDSQEKSYKQD
jgi:hypothetical protein